MSRQDRHAFIASPAASDMKRPGNLCKWPAGTYGKIRVDDDGTIVVSHKAYADDVVAFVAGAIESNPTIADEIKNRLRAFVDDMDARAVARHGYSQSADEAAFTWTPLAK
jgi:hypothetical protein